MYKIMFLKIQRLLFITCFSTLALSGKIQAQITADNSLGTIVSNNANSYRISGGSISGSNLFHSFTQFSINTGERAIFNAPTGTAPTNVQNIISRVTGNNISSIDGLIDSSTMPSANFFLVNPSGIVFGANASLNVGGSFTATTANYLEFSDGNKFFAQSTAGEILSSAPISAFGFTDANVGKIEINGSQLSVGTGEVLSLVGGDISISNGAVVEAKQGRINVNSIRSTGLSSINNDQTISTDGFSTLGSINLDNSTLDVSHRRSTTGGKIWLRSGTLLLDNAGIMKADSNGSGDVGGIDVNVRGASQILNGSYIQSNADGAGTGGLIRFDADTLLINGGDQLTGIYSQASKNNTGGSAGRVDVRINNQLELLNGGRISSSVFSVGDSGSVVVQAGSVLINKMNSSQNTGIFSQVASNSTGGNAGSVEVLVNGHLEIINGGSISSSTFGPGRAGTVVVQADSLSMDHMTAQDSTGTGILSEAKQGSTGNANLVDVRVNNQLNIFNGADISSSTSGEGNAGIVKVQAGALTIDDMTSTRTTGIFSEAGSSSINGSAGNVEVAVNGYLKMTNGGLISSSTFTNGNAGTVDIFVGGQFDMYNQSNISSSTYGAGNAGSVLVQANSLLLHGMEGSAKTGISSEAKKGSTGNADFVKIVVKDQLNIYSGGNINSSTNGTGNAGIVEIEASALSINQMNSSVSTGIFSETNSIANAGDAGNLNIKVANHLELLHGGAISSTTFTNGNAGIVDIEAGSLTIDALNTGKLTGIFTDTTENSGHAGDLRIIVRNQLALHNGGKISSSTLSTGDAGHVGILTGSLDITNGSTIASDSTSSSTLGGPGNIDIYASGDVVIDNAAIDLSSQTGMRSSLGTKPTINLRAKNLILRNNAQITAQAGSDLPAGDIQIETTETIQLYNRSKVTTSANLGNGGAIVMNTRDYLYLNQSQIKTSVSTTEGAARGGDISIDPIFIILNDSQILAETFNGEGGNITMVADFFMESGNSLISAASHGNLGVDGIIDLQSLNVESATGVDKLPVNLLDATQWAAQACTKKAGNLSSFVFKQVLPMHYDNLLASPLLFTASHSDQSMHSTLLSSLASHSCYL